MELQTLEPLTEQGIVEIKDKEGEVQRSVEEEKAQYEQFLNFVKAARKQVQVAQDEPWVSVRVLLGL